MRVQVWAWQCEHENCKHKWLAGDVVPPEKCSKCKRRGWHKNSVPPIDHSRGHNIPDYPLGISFEDARFAEGVSVRVVPKGALEDRKAIAMQAMSDAFMREPETISEPELENLPCCFECDKPMREQKGKWACVMAGCAMCGIEQKVRR